MVRKGGEKLALGHGRGSLETHARREHSGGDLAAGERLASTMPMEQVMLAAFNNDLVAAGSKLGLHPVGWSGIQLAECRSPQLPDRQQMATAFILRIRDGGFVIHVPLRRGLCQVVCAYVFRGIRHLEILDEQFK